MTAVSDTALRLAVEMFGIRVETTEIEEAKIYRLYVGDRVIQERVRCRCGGTMAPQRHYDTCSECGGKKLRDTAWRCTPCGYSVREEP